MPNELISVIVGGSIGLIGGLGGVLIGQVLTGRREARSRKIEGLGLVVAELNKRNRLALHIAQIINIGLRDSTPEELTARIFDIPGWKECTHELQDQSWLFPCMAYMPEALSYFEALDNQIGHLMDPRAGKSDSQEAWSRDDSAREVRRIHRSIQSLVQIRLKALQ